MIRRVLVAALVAVLAAGAAASVQAAPADYLLPVEKHTTPKARALAVKYRPQLLQFSEYVYHCLPYVEIKNGLGFKKNAKDPATDDRFASPSRSGRTTSSPPTRFQITRYKKASPARRLLKRAHLLRWRPRLQAQRTGSTPRLQSSGAASHLDPFEQPTESTDEDLARVHV